jgi:uncharacterized membrane protein YfcA
VGLALLVLALGLAGGVASGLLGVGGGIVMAPALLYVPRLVGAGAFDVKEVTGLTIAQGLLACLSGSLGHGRRGLVSRRLVTAMGPAVVAGALGGSVASSLVEARVLMLLLAALAGGAAVLMWLPKAEPEGDGRALNVPLAVLVALAVGLLGGMVGQGGSFLLVPLMLHVLRVPTRVAIGSNLALVLLSSAAGLAGKLATAQVPFVAAGMLALGTVPGAQAGCALSQRMPTRRLRSALGVVVGLSALVLAADVLHSH